MPNVNTADLTSHDYLLPDDLKVQQYNPLAAVNGTGASKAPVFNLKPQSDLEVIEGQHDDYYKKYAALQKFHNYMYANHKIDVTKPDPSNPDSIEGSKIYQKLLADVLSTGDKLHQAKQRSDYMMKGIAEGKLTANNDALQAHLGNNITSNEALSHLAGSGLVSDFAKGVEGEMKGYYDQGQVEEANNLREQALNHLTDKYHEAMDANRLGEAESLQHDIAYIGHPSLMENWRKTNADRDYALRLRGQRYRESQGTKTDHLYDDLIRKFSNILDGNHKSFKQSSNIPTQTGGFYLENNEFTGHQYVGGRDKNGRPITKSIDKILMDPDTGKMFMTFDDGGSQELQRSGDVMPLVTGYIEANTKEFNMKDASAFASAKGLVRKSGGWHYLVEHGHQHDSENYRQNAVVRNQHAVTVMNTIDKTIDDLSLIKVGSPDMSIKSNDGESFEVNIPKSISGEKEDESFTGDHITVESALGKGYNILIDGKAIIKRKSKQQIQQILHQNSILGHITDGNLSVFLGDKDITPKPKKSFYADGSYTNQGVENDNTGNEVTRQNGTYSSSSSTIPAEKDNLGNWQAGQVKSATTKPSLYK